jgi:hypothetical protein
VEHNLLLPTGTKYYLLGVRTQFNQPKRDRANIQWHHSQVSDTKRKLKTPPNGLTKHDLLVAKMDFGFWDNLLRECFSVNGDTKALWPHVHQVSFPICQVVTPMPLYK